MGRSLFEVFRLLTDEVREIVAERRAQGRLRPEASAQEERRLVDRFKEALRVSLVVLSLPMEDGAHRTVRFTGPRELQEADFVAADTLRPLPAGPEALPFWTVRAVRPELPAEPDRGGEAQVLGEIVARSALDQGVIVRAAVCVGEGVLFEDVNGQPAVASLASRRASELLAAAREIAPGRAAFALEGASELVVALLGQRLAGWERAPDGPPDTAVWLGPRS